jgi:hypothetical protein
MHKDSKYCHYELSSPMGHCLYSALALDRATFVCLLLFQVTRLPPKNIQYLVVDRLSNEEPAQSASVKPSIQSSVQPIQ